ncbi:hypothetical protein EON62_00365, partial [archaeon]
MAAPSGERIILVVQSKYNNGRATQALDLEREVRALETVLADFPFARIQLLDGTVDAIQSAVRRHGSAICMIHITSHGEEEGVFLERDGVVQLQSAANLASLLSPLAAYYEPVLITLACCHSEALATDLALTLHIRFHVVGFANAVHEADVPVIVSKLYGGIMSGKTVADSVTSVAATPGLRTRIMLGGSVDHGVSIFDLRSFATTTHTNLPFETPWRDVPSVHNTLLSRVYAAMKSKPDWRVMLHGSEPGVGTSALAYKLAKLWVTESLRFVHGGVWWVQCAHAADVPTLVACLRRMVPPLPPAECTDAASSIAVLKNAARTQGRMLLVLDNVDLCGCSLRPPHADCPAAASPGGCSVQLLQALASVPGVCLLVTTSAVPDTTFRVEAPSAPIMSPFQMEAVARLPCERSNDVVSLLFHGSAPDGHGIPFSRIELRLREAGEGAHLSAPTAEAMIASASLSQCSPADLQHLGQLMTADGTARLRAVVRTLMAEDPLVGIQPVVMTWPAVVATKMNARAVAKLARVYSQRLAYAVSVADGSACWLDAVMRRTTPALPSDATCALLQPVPTFPRSPPPLTPASPPSAAGTAALVVLATPPPPVLPPALRFQPFRGNHELLGDLTSLLLFNCEREESERLLQLAVSHGDRGPVLIRTCSKGPGYLALTVYVENEAQHIQHVIVSRNPAAGPFGISVHVYCATSAAPQRLAYPSICAMLREKACPSLYNCILVPGHELRSVDCRRLTEPTRTAPARSSVAAADLYTSAFHDAVAHPVGTASIVAAAGVGIATTTSLQYPRLQ